MKIKIEDKLIINERMYELEGMSHKQKMLDWSKNHIGYLEDSVEEVESILTEFTSDSYEKGEKVKLDFVVICSMNQYLVDSVDIITYLLDELNEKDEK